MQRLVESLQVNSVEDLYTQYARFALSYSLEDNPLKALTRFIPRKAEYYVVVPVGQTRMAETVMRRLAGRRKLRSLRVDKDDIRYSDFSPIEQMVIYYA